MFAGSEIRCNRRTGSYVAGPDRIHHAGQRPFRVAGDTLQTRDTQNTQNYTPWMLGCVVCVSLRILRSRVGVRSLWRDCGLVRERLGEAPEELLPLEVGLHRHALVAAVGARVDRRVREQPGDAE